MRMFGTECFLSLLVWLSVAALSVGQDVPWPVGNGTELSCSIMIWGSQDYLWSVSNVTVDKKGREIKNYTSNCIETVKRARLRCGGKALNFVPTHFWKYTDSVAMTPNRFCYKTNIGNDQVPVVCTDLVNWYPENITLAREMIYTFYKGMKGCFITAIWEGFTDIKITPHLDDGTGRAGWRNTLGLDPWVQHEGFSYVDVMLKPLARAISEAMADTKTMGKIKVMFTLQGEMNYALSAYPDSWLGVANQAKEWIAGTKPSAAMAKLIKVGVSLNFNKLCGYFCDGNPIVASTGEAMNMEGFKSLLQQMDYLGISNYPSLSAGLAEGRWDFEGPIDTLDKELQQTFNFGIMDLLKYNDKEFHLSEFGIGGGSDNCGCKAASTLKELQDLTFFGVFGTYGQFQDPWRDNCGCKAASTLKELQDLTFFGVFGTYGQFQDPWRDDWARSFRQDFYKHSILWLANKGGPRFKVDGAFLWCMSSWDVTAIYWTSWNTKLGKSYHDPVVTTMLRNWNNNRWLPCPPGGC